MKSLKTSGLLLLAIIVLTACGGIPIGDGNSIKLSKDGVTVTDKEGQESKVNFNEDEGTMTISTENEDGEQFHSQFGGDIEIPDNFPNDIPFPNDANIHGVTSADDHVLLVLTSNNTYEQIDELYTDFFSRSEFVEQPNIIEQNHGGGERMKIFSGIRGDSSVQVSVMSVHEDVNEDFETQLTITHAKMTE